jgi:hypothetical protein
VAPSELIELGQQALAAVARSVASGAPLVQCQLLASNFYETLRHELQETSQVDVATRGVLIAAANRCHQTANATISPSGMLNELRSAIAILQDVPVAPPTARGPMLRVIEGGLSRI